MSTATWRNVAPTVSVSNNGPKVESSEITYTASATDADATLSYQWYSNSTCTTAIN